MISKADQELFISENNSSIKAGHTKKVINQINKLEKKYGIDFADMNIEQTNELFTDTKSNSVRYLYETNVICERFIDTLKEKGNISKDVKNIYAGKDILYFSRFLKTTELYAAADVFFIFNLTESDIRIIL